MCAARLEGLRAKCWGCGKRNFSVYFGEDARFWPWRRWHEIRCTGCGSVWTPPAGTKIGDERGEEAVGGGGDVAADVVSPEI